MPLNTRLEYEAPQIDPGQVSDSLSLMERQLSLSTIGRTSSVVGNDCSTEKVTMQTRVAVRDKNPHRFQVVPLRDVSKNAAPAEEYSLFGNKTLASQTTLLRSSSGKLGPYCQTRSLATSSSSLAISPKSFEDYADKAPLDHPTVDESVQMSFEGVPSSPSVSIRSQHRDRIALSEHDLNKPIHETTTVLSETATTASLTARRSHIRAIHSKPPSDTCSEYGQPTLEKTTAITTSTTGSISIPFDLGVFRDPFVPPQSNDASHDRTNHYCNTAGPRNHLQTLRHPTIVSFGTLPTGSQTHKRKSRTLSENNLKVIGNTREQNNQFLRVSRTSIDASSRKRHAMYSQSLCVPFFEFSIPPRFDLQGNQPIQQSNSQPLWLSDNPRDAEGLGHPKANSSSLERLVPYLESPHSSGDTEEQGIPKLDPQNALRTPSGSASSILPSVLTGGLTSTNASFSIPVLPPLRALRYPRLSRLPPKGPRPKEVVYSQIVLDLFTDIDRAIDEWNHRVT